MSDIIITPASGKIDFYKDLGAASLAKIELTATNDLALSSISGNLIIGDASRDIYIGNGINDVDIIFEQNGEIRPLPAKTLNIGTSGSFTQILASKVNINQNSFTSIPLDVYSSTSGATILNVVGTKGALFSVTDNLSGSLMSVNNDAGLPVFEVFSDDRVVAGRFGQNDFIMTSGGNVGIGTGVPSSKFHVVGSVLFSSGLSVSGLITSNSGNFINSLTVNSTGVSISGHTHTSSDISNFNSSVSGVVSGIYAPLSSPALIGTPTAPTASSGTNTTQIASTAFVRTEISNLVASAPTTLDTLNELATALGNDANFSTTVTTSLGGKANLSGATFTGSVSGPSGNFTSLKVNSVDVSAVGHTHTSSNITDFNSSVSGLLPVKNILGSGYASVSSVSGTYTVSVTGLQPSGNYANLTHSHILNDISNINGNRGDISVNNSGTTWVLNSGIINTQHLNSEIIIDCGLIFETPPVTTDPYFAQVNLLAHFNNTNNSTAFIDSSSFNRTLTRTGANAVISTTQSKFGGSSLYLGATGGSHYLTSTTISSVGIQDYVIEGWFYFSSLTGLNRVLFGWGQDNLYISALGNKLVLTQVESDNTAGSATLLNNTWHHIAWVRRYNNSITIYCDGVATLIVTSNTWGRNDNMGSVPVVVGGGSSYYQDRNFYIDDFRVTINQPRYTGNFTPPTTTFEDS